MKTVALFVALALLASPALTEETDLDAANARIAELEAKVKMLEAQIAMLKAELKDTKAEAKEAKSADVKDGADEPESADDEVETFSSLQDVLRQMPRELRPDKRGGWSRFEEAKKEEAHEWLKTAPVGAEYRRRVEIRSITIRKNTLPGATEGRQWMAVVYFVGDKAQFEGISIAEEIGPYTVYGDADFVRRAEEVKAGIKVTLTGKIDRVYTLLGIRGGSTINLQLDDWVIHHPVLQNSGDSEEE